MRRLLTVLLLVLGIAVVAAGAGLLGLGGGAATTRIDGAGAAVAPTDSARPSPSSAPAAGTELRVAAAPARRVGAVTAQAPLRVRLPSGAWLGVRPADTRPDGLLDVPPAVEEAGWWPGSARVGDPFGSTLLAAHVDSVTEGLGPFAELLSARPGQRVVLTSRGLTQTFTIRSAQVLDRDTLAQHPRIHAPSGPRRLTLVTCAPPYVRAEGGYQNLMVVEAIPVGEPRRLRGGDAP